MSVPLPLQSQIAPENKSVRVSCLLTTEPDGVATALVTLQMPVMSDPTKLSAFASSKFGKLRTPALFTLTEADDPRLRP